MKLKTVFLTVVLIVSLSQTIKAQSFTYGLTAGIDVSNPHIRVDNNFLDFERVYYPLTTFNANVHLGMKAKELIGFSIEPGFIRKGGIQETINFLTGADQSAKIVLNYLQVPLYADFYITDELSVSIGPEFSYLLNSNIIFEGEKYDYTSEYKEDIDISANIGINYNVYDNFDIGLRYSHGFLSYNKIEFVDETGNILLRSNIYNQYFQFMIRYRLSYKL